MIVRVTYLTFRIDGTAVHSHNKIRSTDTETGFWQHIPPELQLGISNQVNHLNSRIITSALRHHLNLLLRLISGCNCHLVRSDGDRAPANRCSYT